MKKCKDCDSKKFEKCGNANFHENCMGFSPPKTCDICEQTANCRYYKPGTPCAGFISNTFDPKDKWLSFDPNTQWIENIKDEIIAAELAGVPCNKRLGPDIQTTIE